MPAPVLVLGDLNLPGVLPQAATGWTSLARLPTYPSQNPRIQFDHVLGLGVDQGDVLAARAQRMDISDHCALVVDLDLGRALARADRRKAINPPR
jgi:endonuclease/exonuclease/phosphatase family metal-dependent hydrolase